MRKSFMFVVYTPLQLINCLEFYSKARNGSDVSELNFILISHPENIDKLFDLTVQLNDSEANIYKFEDPSIRKNSFLEVFFSRILSKKKILKLLNKPYDYLVHSSVDKSIVRYISNYGIFRERIMIDDGLATLIFLNKLHDEEKNRKTIQSLLRFILKKVEDLIYSSPSEYILSEYTLFSNFNGPKERSFKNVIKNNFLELKRKFKVSDHKIRKKHVHFLGQPLSELGLVSEYDYVQAVVRIGHGISEMEYYPHPTESEKKLAVLSDRGVKVVSGVYGYETFILQSDFYPEKIYTFYSSAAVVLTRVLSGTGINVSAIMISSELGFHNVSKDINIKKIYNNLSDLDVSIINNNF